MRTNAFTLIELMVVISIIALLASMLIPAVSVVRSSAKSADCLNRLRQMGLAFEVYLNDNDHIYPPADDWYGYGGFTNYVLGIYQSAAPTDGTAQMFMCSEDRHKPTDLIPAGILGRWIPGLGQGWTKSRLQFRGHRRQGWHSNTA